MLVAVSDIEVVSWRRRNLFLPRRDGGEMRGECRAQRCTLRYNQEDVLQQWYGHEGSAGGKRVGWRGGRRRRGGEYVLEYLCTSSLEEALLGHKQVQEEGVDRLWREGEKQ